MGSRSTYRSSVPLSAAHGVTRPVVGQMFHVKHWLLCRWCSGRRRALLWGRGAVCAGGRWPAREPSVPRVVVCCTLVFWAPEAPAAREIATREPAARSGRSRSPPVPSGPSGALHTGGVRLTSHPGSRTLITEPTTNVACNSPATVSNFEFTSLKFRRFQTLLKRQPIELHAKFRGALPHGAKRRACRVRPGSLSRRARRGRPWLSPGARRAPGAWREPTRAASQRSGTPTPPTRRPSRSSGTSARPRGR